MKGGGNNKEAGEKAKIEQMVEPIIKAGKNIPMSVASIRRTGHPFKEQLMTEMDVILKSWARLNIWLAEQTDEQEVKKMLEHELAPGRKTRPTIALRIYMKFSNLRRQREMKELYSR